MKCPSCNQSASSFLRNAFTLQGVTLMQSLKGQLRCKNCKALLHISKFNRQMWYLFGGMVFIVVLIMILARQLFLSFGTGGVATYWLIICSVFVLVFMYGTWKYAVLEKIEGDNMKMP
jgi:hypothetical protein